MLKKIKRFVYKKLYNNLNNRKKCVLKAAEEQGLTELMQKLKKIVSDDLIKNQYTYNDTSELTHTFWITKIRAQQTFQIYILIEALKKYNLLNNDKITVVDIGDSAGTHQLYLNKLYDNINSLSVNLDENAVDKIKKRGLEAVCCRAEELDKYNIKSNIFMSFEMLEHIISPIDFLKNMSDKTDCDCFVITVPFVRKSRMGLQYIRNNVIKKYYGENLHIFELSPEDWKLIFKFSGWKPVYEKIYYQYPKKGIYKYTKSVWQKYDFEGFYGVILEKDDTYKKLYEDWG